MDRPTRFFYTMVLFLLLALTATLVPAQEPSTSAEMELQKLAFVEDSGTTPKATFKLFEGGIINENPLLFESIFPGQLNPKPYESQARGLVRVQLGSVQERPLWLAVDAPQESLTDQSFERFLNQLGEGVFLTIQAQVPNTIQSCRGAKRCTKVCEGAAGRYCCEYTCAKDAVMEQE